MENPDPGERGGFPLPPVQLVFLLLILLGYPALNMVMGILGHSDPAEMVSKIAEVYIPTLLVQAVLIIALVAVLRKSRGKFADIGFARGDITWSNVLSAVIFFMGAWGLMVLIKGSVERSGYLPQTDFYHLLPANSMEASLWVILSAGAAFSEELIFRGYVITRIRKLTGSFWLGAVLGSAAFSFGHLYQGMAGVLLTFIYGLLFSGLFIARKSVFPCVVAHFMQDVVVLGALFFY
jgi:membrane protease YdiL (CAAX protease family)